MLRTFLFAFRFPSKRILNTHLPVHSDVCTCMCDICGSTFKNKYSLKKHIQFQHSEGPRKDKEPHQCPICDKVLRGKKGLRAHMSNIHEGGEQEHRCKICNHVSTTAKGLRVHEIFRHEKERKHKCTLCDKAFKRPLDLKVSTGL